MSNENDSCAASLTSNAAPSSLSGVASAAYPKTNVYEVKRCADALVIGRVRFYQSPQGGGWQYTPFTDAHNPSRKLHSTPDAAIKGRARGCMLERMP